MSTNEKTVSTLCVTSESDESVSLEQVRPVFDLLRSGRANREQTAASWWLPTVLADGATDTLGVDNRWHLKSWAICDRTEIDYVVLLVSAAASHQQSSSRWEDFLDSNMVADVKAAGFETEEGGITRALQQARARRELGEIETRRAIWNAFQRGWSQRDIGELVGRSQPDVGRTIKKVDSNPSNVEINPREVALRRLIGEYSGTEMIARLLTLGYTVGTPEPSIVGGGYVPGTWDQVRELRNQNLITEEEWQELFRAIIGDEVEGTPTIVVPETDA